MHLTPLHVPPPQSMGSFLPPRLPPQLDAQPHGGVVGGAGCRSLGSPSRASLPILLRAQDTGWEGTGVTRSPQECTTGNSARRRPLSLIQLRKNPRPRESVLVSVTVSAHLTHTHSRTHGDVLTHSGTHGGANLSSPVPRTRRPLSPPLSATRLPECNRTDPLSLPPLLHEFQAGVRHTR